MTIVLNEKYNATLCEYLLQIRGLFHFQMGVLFIEVLLHKLLFMLKHLTFVYRQLMYCKKQTWHLMLTIICLRGILF